MLQFHLVTVIKYVATDLSSAHTVIMWILVQNIRICVGGTEIF